MKNPNAYKSVTSARDNFTASSAKAQTNYVAAVKNPNTTWAAQASSDTAQAAMKTGLLAALNDNRIADGINRVGDQKWRTNSAVKGGPALGTQISNAGTAYQNAMNTVYSDMSSAAIAYETAYTANGGGYSGREAGGLAYRKALHDAAVTRKGKGSK
jgi:hypothetical protein